jgi:hypothetical protein
MGRSENPACVSYGCALGVWVILKFEFQIEVLLGTGSENAASYDLPAPTAAHER